MNLDSGREMVRLEGDETLSTYGGEAWIDGELFDGYGIDFGKFFVDEIRASQMVRLAIQIVDHLILNGHRFALEKTGEQDQWLRLRYIDHDSSEPIYMR
jgi:hypothetical protein